MPSLDLIRESIEAHVAELRREMTSLQAARAALRDNKTAIRTTTAVAVESPAQPKRRNSSKTASDGGATAGPTKLGNAEAASAPTAAAREPATARKPREGTDSRSGMPRKPFEVLLAGKLEAMLRESEDGLSAKTIAKRANASDSQVRDLLRELESAGQVRQTGARRTSRWSLITDHERIAQRAAELEKRSTATP